MFRGDYLSQIQPTFDSGYELNDVLNLVFPDATEETSDFQHLSLFTGSPTTTSSEEDFESPPSSPFDESNVKEEPEEAVRRYLSGKSSLFSLTREDLLKLSSETLDNLIQNLASERPLTDEERRQLKKQKRLIKNRESAQLSRQRKKVYLEELEQRVGQLSDENDGFKKRLMLIGEENRRMKEELHRFRSSGVTPVATGGMPGAPPVQSNSGNAGSSQMVPSKRSTVSTVATRDNNANTNNIRNVRAAGLCLLVIVFSFGLFFNSRKELLSNKFQHAERLKQIENEIVNQIQDQRSSKLEEKKDMSENQSSSKKRKLTEVILVSGDGSNVKPRAELLTQVLQQPVEYLEEIEIERSLIPEEVDADTNSFISSALSPLDHQPSVLSAQSSPNITSTQFM